MKLWHLADLKSEWGDDAGWVVMAETADEARRLVLARRDAEWRQSEARGTDAERRRRYFGAYLPDDPDPDEQVGEPRELTDPVYGIPVLGHIW